MSNRIEPLAGERQPGESNKAVQACNDFLRLGPGRSLVVLLKGYRETQENTAPTRKQNTLWRWSADYLWQDRSGLYDQRLEDEKNKRAKAIMESGLALDYERVVELKTLADFLKQQIFAQAPVIVVTQADQEQPSLSIGETYPYVWLRDVKQIGQGDKAQRVDIIRFNSALLDQFRGVLDDLAKETGGRIAKHEVSGPNGGSIDINDEHHNRAISSLASALGALISGSGSSEESDVGSTMETAVGSAADEGV
jgi:hypothetical protein